MIPPIRLRLRCWLGKATFIRRALGGQRLSVPPLRVRQARASDGLPERKCWANRTCDNLSLLSRS